MTNNYLPDQQYSLCTDPFLLHVISFCGNEPNRKTTNQTQEHLTELNNTFEESVPLFRLTSWWQALSMILPGCRSVEANEEMW